MAFYYGSSGDIRELIGNTTETELDGALITLGQKKAYGIINGKLQRNYPTSVPFASGAVPEIINTISDDLAVYFAYRTKYPGPAPLKAEIKEWWERAMEMLDEIKEGLIAFPESAQASADRIVGDPSSSSTPVFDIDRPEDWQIDPDRLDDIQRERDV